jgi:hypothetical protein
MATCVGCGAELAPEWKFCIHCGIAADAREIPAAIRPDDAAAEPVARSTRSRILLVAAVAAFAIAAVLLLVAIAALAGALK